MQTDMVQRLNCKTFSSQESVLVQQLAAPKMAEVPTTSSHFATDFEADNIQIDRAPVSSG